MYKTVQVASFSAGPQLTANTMTCVAPKNSKERTERHNRTVMRGVEWHRCESQSTKFALCCRLCMRDYPVGVLSVRNRKLLITNKGDLSPGVRTESSMQTEITDGRCVFVVYVHLPCRYRRCTAIALFLTSLCFSSFAAVQTDMCAGPTANSAATLHPTIAAQHIWTHNCGSSNWQPGNTRTWHSVNTFDMPFIALLCTRKGNDYTEGNFARIPGHRTLLSGCFTGSGLSEMWRRVAGYNFPAFRKKRLPLSSVVRASQILTQKLQKLHTFM